MPRTLINLRKSTRYGDVLQCMNSVLGGDDVIGGHPNSRLQLKMQVGRMKKKCQLGMAITGH
jgi:hypothetical protein